MRRLSKKEQELCKRMSLEQTNQSLELTKQHLDLAKGYYRVAIITLIFTLFFSIVSIR